MKILIVEDDELAADFIEALIIDHFNDFEIVGKVKSVKEASKTFNLKKPDVLIMDINLGDHTSFDLFEYIDYSQLTVIFTSSYQEYALKAIKVDAVDYLLKPININDFKQALEKVRQRFRRSEHVQNSLHADNIKSITNHTGSKVLIYENDKVNPVELDQIIKIKSDGSYSEIFLSDNRRFTSAKNLGMYEKLLQDKYFLRIHDSCLVNSKHVQNYMPGQKAYIILSDGSMENMSRSKKREFLNFYGK